MREPPDLSFDRTLPEMTGEQALTVVRILQLISDSIWRIHGHEMGSLICADDPLVQLADRDEQIDLDIDDLPF